MSAQRWQDIAPAEASNIELPYNGIEGPMNEMGERCPWPWDPQQLVGAPIGQYHCPYCGGMVLAGMEHLDFSADDAARQGADRREGGDRG